MEIVPPFVEGFWGGRGEGEQQAGPAFVADAGVADAGHEPSSAAPLIDKGSGVHGLFPPGVASGFGLQFGIADGAEGEQGAEEEDAAIGGVADAFLGDAEFVRIAHVLEQVAFEEGVAVRPLFFEPEREEFDEFAAAADGYPVGAFVRGLDVGMPEGEPGVEAGAEFFGDPAGLAGGPEVAAPVIGIGEAGADGGAGEAVALVGEDGLGGGAVVGGADGAVGDGAVARLAGDLREEGGHVGVVGRAVAAGGSFAQGFLRVDFLAQAGEHLFVRGALDGGQPA